MAVRRVGTDDECRREEESMVLAAERGSARREEPSSEWPVTSEERTVSQPAPLAVLMAAFRDGDAGAFEDVHAQVFALCYHRARRLGASHEEAEDVAEETAVAIWMRRARSFDPERGSLEGWLAIGCANRLKDLWKRKDRQRRLESKAAVDLTTAPSPEEALVQREDGGEVRACLERLAPLQREVLDRVMGGHTNHEIAEELGIPEGRVRCVKFRALRRMQQLLRRFGHRPLSGVDSPATSGADEPAGGKS